MKVAVFLALALLSGLAVLALVLARSRDGRSGPDFVSGPRDEGAVSDRGRSTEGADAFAFGHGPVAGQASVRTRLLALLGLVALIAASAGALAVALWQIGHLINRELANFRGG